MEKFSKKMALAFAYLSISAGFVVLLLFTLLQVGFLGNFSSVKFSKDKLSFASSKLALYDDNNAEIEQNFTTQGVSLSELPPYLVQAFISVEDKNFYSHDGLNYPRILKAVLKNIKSFKMKEGASTISQQLIKNTHLTSEKTLKRKFNEMILTKELEKHLDKDEILASYLNAIYFGNGAFGINCASQRYFSKPAKELTLPESALLAGIIKSPKIYSPIHNKENALKRRNFVLGEMFKDGKISKEEYETSINKDIKLNLQSKNLGQNSYENAVIDEACKILKIQEKDLKVLNYKIYTYLDKTIQKNCEQALENSTIKNKKIDGAVMVIGNKNGGIRAYFGSSKQNVLSLKRQPGSVLKPVVAYAPAIENNLISPSTLLLDEKTNFGGYAPKNYNDAYHGWVSARTALANSYNVPSVKILSYLGLDKAKDFAKKMGIDLSADNGYSIALGGLTNGVKIKDIANCYQTFGNGGRFVEAKFIKQICDENGNVIYKNSETQKQIMKDSTAYLITDMLKEGVKNGTSRKLNLSGLEIAGKTGTAGVQCGTQNSDVWSISYTPNNTLCVWCGADENLLEKSITGANLPTDIAQKIYKTSNLSQGKFIAPSSVKEVEINELDYLNNNKILLASESTPERFKRKELFATDNLPKEISTMFEKLDDFEILVTKKDEKSVQISFDAKKYLTYDIFRSDENSTKLLKTISNKFGVISEIDDTLEEGKLYSYYAVCYPSNDKSIKATSNSVKIYLAQKNPQFMLKKWVSA